jgi:predicted Rossmann fold flavoprotein
MERERIMIAGGGAAGFFAAIACAESAPALEVVLCETGAQPLAKVRISGGGRCNVTHAWFDPRELVKGYPRGARELLGPLTRFGPREIVDWFAARGVELKAEADGRMFPVTDDSATIVDCLLAAASRAGVRLATRCGVRRVEREVSAPASGSAGPGDANGSGSSFRVTLTSGESWSASRVLLATGGGKGSAGLAIAESLGHTFEPPVPSLFTFHIDDSRLVGIEGVVAPMVAVAVGGSKLRETGPLLVTHWGVSGPAILKLSAWGARELHTLGYHFTLIVNWVAPRTQEQARAALAAERASHPKRKVLTANPFGLSARLWERLVLAAGVGPEALWSGVANPTLAAIAAQLVAGEFQVEGKSMNKEEFVTCGGVRLAEVNFATMESRVCPRLHLAGEILDIDGITGGYNFQSAWTTGWHAGRAMAGGATDTSGA